MWQLLRRKQRCGMKFRREHPLGNYIADFYCAAVSLVVEIDGLSHQTTEAKRYDMARDRWMQSQGIQILRFSCAEVEHQTESVIDRIDDKLRQLAQIEPLSPNPSPQRGEGSNR